MPAARASLSVFRWTRLGPYRWLRILAGEVNRAREREARRRGAGRRSGRPSRLIEGKRVMGRREALSELGSTPPTPVASASSR